MPRALSPCCALSLARQETQSAIVNRASKSMGIAYLFICKFVT